MILPFLLPLKIGMNIGPERAGEERGQGAVERGRESWCKNLSGSVGVFCLKMHRRPSRPSLYVYFHEHSRTEWLIILHILCIEHRKL